MKTAAIYCRVSTDNQESEGTSLQTQLEACLQYCQERNLNVTYRFSETYSGLILERPKLNELRELVRSGRLDVVLVYSLDRFSRDPVHGVILMQELEKYGVKLEAASETVDNTEVGKLVFYIKGYAAKLDAERRKDSTSRGKKAYLQMGKLPTGTGQGLFGYKWDSENKKRMPLDFEAKVVQRVFNMLADGLSCFNIARTLNANGIPAKTGGKWSARTIYNMAGNSSYIGSTYYGRTRGSRKTKLIKQPENEWLLLPDTTPAIISKELFTRVQEIRQQNKELHFAKTKHDYLLRGHVFCGHCRSPLVGSFLNHRFRYYHCRGTYATATRQRMCNAHYIRADYLEDVVWQKLREVLENPQIVLAGIKEQLNEESNRRDRTILDKEIHKLKHGLKSYDSQEKRLVQLFRYGEISQDVILDELNQLKKDRQLDMGKLEAYLKTKERLTSLERAEVMLSEYCRQLHKELDKANYQDKRVVLDMLAIRVTATSEALDIQGVIPLQPTPTWSSDNLSYLLTTGQTSA